MKYVKFSESKNDIANHVANQKIILQINKNKILQINKN
jgi:hypothetical protein